MDQKEMEAKISEIDAKVNALYELIIAKANVANAFLNEVLYPETQKEQKEVKKNAK